MSGGRFDYNQHRITDIADTIEHILDRQGTLIPKEDLFCSKEYYDEYPGDLLYPEYPLEIQAKMQEAIKHLRIAAIYAQRLDWYLSGDDGEGTFLTRLTADLDNLSL